jgi:membrane-bound lytic murein transglycosylase D
MRTTLCALVTAFSLLILPLAPLTAHAADPYPLNYPFYHIDEIKFRLLMMNSPVVPVFNAEVESYIRRYLTYNAADTEKILGRSIQYFPIFEHYLAMHGLPEALKYLPIVESELVPYSVSVHGAAGLWQFVPATAQAFGLVVDQYIDERKDAYKSTEAAVKYLKRLYNRFGTWELALAAYNCGPTRLSRVIQEKKCQDFWQIRDRLPRETQQYISRYLAASYVGNFYSAHGLQPAAPPSGMDAMAARVYKPISLSEISRATGLELATIKSMNPSFKRDRVPAKAGGVFVVLPRGAWYAYLDSQPNENEARP